jgi:hypothetical protein
MSARSVTDSSWEAWRRERLADVNADDGPAALVTTVWLDDVQPGARRRFDGVTIQPVLREGRAGVRVFEHARSGSVTGIDAFPYAPEWVIDGVFEPLPLGTSAPYGYALESAPRVTEVAGTLTFELLGRRYETMPLVDEGSLLLVFADATTGVSTKAPGRFLDIPRPPVGTDRVRLDFNRTYLPPCAFSDEFNCPLPPADHRFAGAVTAGETFVSSG